MNAASARWTCMQLESLLSAAVRELERLDGLLEGAPARPAEAARMALTDARRLLERAHYVRRTIEELGPVLPPVA